jgi:hypothetical protein
MAKSIEEIELSWTSLTNGPDATGWRSIAVSSPAHVTLRAGRSFPGQEEALLVGFLSATIAAAEKLPESQGFAVTRLEATTEAAQWLALTRKSTGSFELFTAMVSDVVESLNAAEPTNDEKSLLRIFLGRIRAWQEFMRKGAMALSPEAELGLVGELAALDAIIKEGVAASIAIEGWLGPLDGIQDFHLGLGALEIKASISPAGFPAKIGSLEQLDDRARQPLFVVGAKFRQIDSGRNLPTFIADLLASLGEDHESQRLFGERLLAAGYFTQHADRYPRRFVLSEIRVVEVIEGFPRLIQGSIPTGILSVRYEIDLDRAPGERITMGQALKRMGAV